VLEIFARTSRRPPQESVVRRLGVLAANRQLGKSAANVATAKVGTGASAIFSTPKCVGSSE
jgi:hypothetical protein